MADNTLSEMHHGPEERFPLSVLNTENYVPLTYIRTTSMCTHTQKEVGRKQAYNKDTRQSTHTMECTYTHASRQRWTSNTLVATTTSYLSKPISYFWEPATANVTRAASGQWARK